MSTEPTKQDISKELGNSGIMIQPSAAEEIISSEIDTSSILSNLTESVDSGSILDVDEVQNHLSSISSTESEEEDVVESEEEDVVESEEEGNSIQTERASLDSINPDEAFNKLKNKNLREESNVEITNRKETLSERYPELCKTLFDRDFPESKPRNSVITSHEISGDVTGNSRGTGDFEDFRSLFTSRFEKLYGLLQEHAANQVYKVSELNKKSHGGKNIIVAGLVWDKFVSSNDNYFIELETPKSNDTMRVVFTDENMKEPFEEVVPDEAVAIRGQLSDDGGIVFGDSEVRKGRPPIMHPEIPPSISANTVDREAKVALVSDIHIGAEEFYAKYWNKFVDWVRETPSIEYVLVAGDLVEGIGVYPDQDEELTVVDIYDQYALTGKMFDKLPNDVQIIASVGNHDTVRLAEPQPALGEKFTKYFGDNVEFVGNPVTVDIEGYNILMYHGMSINALSEVIPGLDAGEPAGVMKAMLKKRHVAPVYGKNVRLAGEEKDYLVIDKVPNLLHCGHVHKYEKDEYNGVHIVNTASWQGQTAFQKSKGIEPDVGYWATLNLQTNEVKEYRADTI